MPNVRLLELRNTYKWGGGPDKTILLSAELHNPNRVAVVVVYIKDVRDEKFQITHLAREKGLIYYEIEESGKFDFNVLLKIEKIIRKHNINLIHAHDVKSDLFAYLLRWWPSKHPISFVSTAHGWASPSWRSNIYKSIDLFLMKRFDRLIAVSEATKTLMMESGIPQRLIQVVHNGIDIDVWSPRTQGRQSSTGLNLEEAFPVIGYVGRITEEKDLQTWIQVAAKVISHFPKARFVVVGEGKDAVLQKELESQTKRLGIAEHVLFMGYQDALQPVYAQFDAFLLTSDREGLPNCILEAMAMGMPVVSTKVGGVPELVVDGQTGFLLQVGDVDGLSRATLNLAQNEKLRIDMGRRGRDRVEEKFSFRNRLQVMESLYEQLSSACSC